jgi:hypothetical protein
MTKKNLHPETPIAHPVKLNIGADARKSSRIETFYSHTNTLPNGFQIHFTAGRILPKGQNND